MINKVKWPWGKITENEGRSLCKYRKVARWTRRENKARRRYEIAWSGETRWQRREQLHPLPP